MFKPLAKPARRSGAGTPTITIGHAQKNRQTYLALNSAARQAIGDPRAVTLAWDQSTYQMLITPATPSNPDAYLITESSGRCSVTGIMRQLGLTPEEAHSMPARKHGTTGLVIDVSGIRTRSLTPVRRAA